MSSIRKFRKEIKRLRMNAAAARARADYYSWRQERFECEMDELILRIGKYNPNGDMKFRVSVDEVIETVFKLTGYRATFAQAVEFMHLKMSGG